MELKPKDIELINHIRLELKENSEIIRKDKDGTNYYISLKNVEKIMDTHFSTHFQLSDALERINER